MENNFLSLKNMKKIYPNGFQAIFNLNLSVNKGEFVVFVGPSGCGKSTTIRMIAGLEDVSSGQILINGRNATDLPARKRNISMVFQNYALFPHLTVKENMAFTLKTKRIPREIIEKKIKWAAEILKLQFLLNRKPANLSGGQRQRVALGRAIVAEPDLFLMDEPLSNLDAKLRGVMRSTIRSLHDELQSTTIYVTHDQVEAMTMADKIVVMSDGFIQQVGSPEEVYAEPANKFVASFIGTPSINILDGEYVGQSFKANNGTIKVGKTLLRKCGSKKYQLGFRPQYAQFSKTKAVNSFKCEVNLIEILGSETIVHTKEGMRVVVDTYQKPQKGDTIYIKPDLKKIILFDAVNGISLTNKINKETMASLTTFYKSENLIKARMNLMEKQKNKKANETLVGKGFNFINKKMFPEYILLNPDYFSLKSQIRKIKIKIKDAQRRRELKEITALKTELVLKQKLLKEKIAMLSSYKSLVTTFDKNVKSVNKITTSLKSSKNKELQKQFIALKKQGDEICKSFSDSLVYDFNKIKEFNIKFSNMRKKK